MATYVDYRPGPSITEQYNAISDVLDQLFENLPDPFLASMTWGFSGPPSGLDWQFAGFAYVAGAQPYIRANWNSTTLGHVVEIRHRFNPTLLGTLDPSVAFVSDNRYPSFWLGASSAAVWASWQAAQGGGQTGANNCASFVGNLHATLCTAFAASPTAYTVTTAALLYTDGSRAGKIAAIIIRLTYDPSASELAGGILQMLAERHAFPSDVADGTINAVVGDGLEAGTAQSQVPVVTYSSGQAEQSWLDLTNAVAGQTAVLGDVDLVPLMNNRTITHVDDLGGATPSTTEPAEADAIPIFQTSGSAEVAIGVGVLPATVDAFFGAITTFTGGALAFVLAVGSFFAAARAAGIIAAVYNAAIAIATTIADAIVAIPGALGDLVAQVTGAGTALTSIASGTATLQVGNVQDVATAIGEGLTPEVTEVGLQAAGIRQAVEALEAESGRSCLLALESQATATTALTASVVADLVPAVQGSSTALAGVEQAVDALQATSGRSLLLSQEAIAAQVEVLATQVQLLQADIECICENSDKLAKAIYGDPLDVPNQPGIAVLLRELGDRLQMVADTRNVLHVRVKGIEVQAESGAIIE